MRQRARVEVADVSALVREAEVASELDFRFDDGQHIARVLLQARLGLVQRERRAALRVDEDGTRDQQATDRQGDHQFDETEAAAAAYGVSRTAAAYSWLMAHPARPIPIVGTQNVARIREAADAFTVRWTRTSWYEVFVAARGEKLP